MSAAALLFVSAFIMAGDSVRFDEKLQPQFTAKQINATSDAARAGLARWAATEQGARLVAYFNTGEYEVIVTEDSSEEGMGRAPQPGIATLAAAAGHGKVKSYELILNPRFFRVPKGMTPLPDQPTTPADMMAAAWAAEMLHIYCYSQGVSLPHHQRPDFQREWRGVAAELGMPMLTHDDDDEGHARRGPAIRWMSRD